MRLSTNNLGLKILALVLAIVIYHALKSSAPPSTSNNDRPFINPR